jgi:PAS domain S-box-containing protein
MVCSVCGAEVSLMPRTTTNPVIVYDAVGRVIDANPAAAALTGIPLEELRGMHMRDFYHPDELPAAEERMRTIGVGEAAQFERWLRCCNRRYIRVAVTGSRLFFGGYRAEYVPLMDAPIELPSRLWGERRQDLTRR